jgi:uncharacterized membrane protein
MAIVAALHYLAAAIWVGGLFFMLVVMRPASGGRMDPSARLPLWHRAFKHFLAWLWGIAGALIATGYILVYAGSDDTPDLHVHLKHVLAWIMVALLAYMTWGPLRATTRAVEHGDRPRAARHLFALRIFSAIALALGFIALFGGAMGRHGF